MTIGTMLTVLFGLVLILAIGKTAFWFVNEGLPEPVWLPARILVAIIGLIALYALAATYLPALH